jgi:hypothetical protein
MNSGATVMRVWPILRVRQWRRRAQVPLFQKCQLDRRARPPGLDRALIFLNGCAHSGSRAPCANRMIARLPADFIKKLDRG